MNFIIIHVLSFVDTIVLANNFSEEGDMTEEKVKNISAGSFTIFHVPLILFEGISKEYGLGKIHKKNGYKINILNRRKLGFTATIGFSNANNRTTNFVLWPYFTDSIGTLEGPRSLLRITAMEKVGSICFVPEGGLHSYSVTECISVRVYDGDTFSLGHEANCFVRWIWEKAEEIVTSKNCTPPRDFWRVA